MKNGSYILLDTLIQNNVEYIFGYPGGAILPIYDEIFFWEKKQLIKHILVRHEQSAAHAADAYSRVTKKVGVCFATSGPGATNLVTGIATAKLDSIPLIVITGQVNKNLIGTDAFQEVDICSLTLPLVKASYLARNLRELPKLLNEAFFIAQNGRPGPVLIDIPKDLGLETTENYIYPSIKDIVKNKNYKLKTLIKNKSLHKFLFLISSSRLPLIYIGGGSLRSNSLKLFVQFSKLFQIPMTTTLMGKSIINNKNILNLGMLGMHGSAYANFAISECDLLLAIGARFDDRVTGKLDEFATNAEVIHLDIDFSEISKNRRPQLSILGDISSILTSLLKKVKKKIYTKCKLKYWLNIINIWKKNYPLYQFNYNKSELLAQDSIYLIKKIYPNAYYSTDVGQHQMWSAQLLNPNPKKWVSSSGLGTMGFGLPAALGISIANPLSEVVCITGDSSIQMSIQELGTISQYFLNIKVCLINNGWQGMVRQWQESFYGNRFSNSYMQNGMPNFEKLANSYNIKGCNINSIKELYLQLLEEKFSKISSLLNIKVIENENCYPMIVPGKSNNKMTGLKKQSNNIKKWVE